jgi:hypothetical protein
MSMQPSDSDQASLSYPPLDASSSERIAQMARLHLGDLPTAFSCRQVANGAVYKFELPVENIDAPTMQVVITDGTSENTTTLNTSGYTCDYRRGTLMLNSSPNNGLFLVVSGVYYRDLLAAEIDLYVRQCYLQHVYGTNPTPQIDIYPAPGPPAGGYSAGVYGTPAPPGLPEIEEYPLSLQVAIMALEDRATQVAQEMDVRTPDGVTISRQQVFSQIRTQIAALDQRYMNIAAALNVGLYRISVSTLRRVSYTTNRLIPIYRPREYDDLAWAQREIPLVDTEATVYSEEYLWLAGTAYNQNDLVAEGGQRYVALQNVPIGGPDPITDVNPLTGTGYYWATTNIDSSNWYGTW